MKKVVGVGVATALIVFTIIYLGYYKPAPQWFNGKKAEIKYSPKLDESLKSELEAAVPRGSLRVNDMSVSYRSIFKRETNQYFYFFSNFGDLTVHIDSPLIRCLTNKTKLPLKAGQSVLLSISYPVSPREVEAGFGFRYEEVGVLFFMESEDNWPSKDRAGTTAYFILPAGAAE
jgi:hypothetical protein